MKAYCYDEKGVFAGQTECFLDPLETELQGKEVYLLPANATFNPVPDYNVENQYCVFLAKEWIVENYPELQPIEPEPPSVEERLEATEAALLTMMEVLG